MAKHSLVKYLETLKGPKYAENWVRRVSSIIGIVLEPPKLISFWMYVALLAGISIVELRTELHGMVNLYYRNCILWVDG